MGRARVRPHAWSQHSEPQMRYHGTDTCGLVAAGSGHGCSVDCVRLERRDTAAAMKQLRRTPLAPWTPGTPRAQHHRRCPTGSHTCFEKSRRAWPACPAAGQRDAVPCRCFRRCSSKSSCTPSPYRGTFQAAMKWCNIWNVPRTLGMRARAMRSHALHTACSTTPCPGQATRGNGSHCTTACCFNQA